MKERILRTVAHYPWTLMYVAAVSTATLVLVIMQGR